MSYDITVRRQPEDAVVLFTAKHNIAGGTYSQDGTAEAWVNCTYNYSPMFNLYMGDGGMGLLEGKPLKVVSATIAEAIKKLCPAAVYTLRGLNTKSGDMADVLLNKTVSELLYEAPIAIEQLRRVRPPYYTSKDDAAGIVRTGMANEWTGKICKTLLDLRGIYIASDDWESRMAELKSGKECGVPYARKLHRIIESYVKDVSRQKPILSNNKWAGQPKYECLNSYWAPTPVNVLGALGNIRLIELLCGPDETGIWCIR